MGESGTQSQVTLEQVSSGIWVGPSGASCLCCQPLCCSLHCIKKPILKHESDWVAPGRACRIALEKGNRAKIKTGRKTGVEVFVAIYLFYQLLKTRSCLK